MHLDNPQIPNGVSKSTTTAKITRPNAEVAFSTERATLHHDGKHVDVQGPARLSGKGKAKDLGPILHAIKESSRGR